MRSLLAVLLLAGCAAFEPLVNPVDAIVAEAVSASRAPAAEQAAVLARAEQNAQRIGAKTPVAMEANAASFKDFRIDIHAGN